MIEANELRIGNYVSFKFMRIKEVVKIQCINKELIGVRESVYGYDKIKLIPLREEWLIKFGFSKSEDKINENSNYYNTTEYWIQEHIDVDDFIFYGKNNSIELVIKHVHELQNLYFALTGKELVAPVDPK